MIQQVYLGTTLCPQFNTSSWQISDLPTIHGDNMEILLHYAWLAGKSPSKSLINFPATKLHFVRGFPSHILWHMKQHGYVGLAEGQAEQWD
jgi:hypothetical protein